MRRTFFFLVALERIDTLSFPKKAPKKRGGVACAKWGIVPGCATEDNLTSSLPPRAVPGPASCIVGSPDFEFGVARREVWGRLWPCMHVQRIGCHIGEENDEREEKRVS